MVAQHTLTTNDWTELLEDRGRQADNVSGYFF